MINSNKYKSSYLNFGDHKNMFINAITLCYYVYLIYIVTIIIYNMTGNMVSLLALIIFTLFMLLLAMTIAALFKNPGTLFGYKMNTNKYVIIIVVLISLICITWIILNNMQNENVVGGIAEKVRKMNGFNKITREAGKIDATMIKRKLRLKDDNMILMDYSMMELHDIMAMIMMKYDKEHVTINRLMMDILGQKVKEDPDVLYNLLWYLMISSNPLGMNLNKKQIGYIFGLSTKDLEISLGSNYRGLKDRASMLFASLSGQFVEDTENNDFGNKVFEKKYAEVKKYPANVVMCNLMNEMILDGKKNKLYPGYMNAALNGLDMENVLNGIMNSSDGELDKIIEKFELGEKYKELDYEEKRHVILGDITLYTTVFKRPEGLEQPGKLSVEKGDDIMKILSFYTNKELIENYEPREEYENRYELIRNIYMDIVGEPKWSFTHKYCTNDDTMNVITGENHGKINKDDILDPTLSFGVHKNYRCYQTVELEESFRTYDGVFEFRRPDWMVGQDMKEFEIKDMKNLEQTLIKSKRKSVKQLLDKIHEGFRVLGSAKMQLIKLKTQYNSFAKDEKEMISLYLGWMFVYSMWMRFWKGPGYYWPMSKVNVLNARVRKLNERASSSERDEHVSIQQLVQSSIIEDFENNKKLYYWIKDLPAIYYDFETFTSKIASYPIEQTLEQTALGKSCMGFSSDTILKTAVCYITEILEIPFGEKFDKFINGVLKTLSEIERDVLESKLYHIGNKNSLQHSILVNRHRELEKGSVRQPGFDPSSYENNIHV